MKIIRKRFKTLAAAERFHNALYERYSRVTCIDSPFVGESGFYTWRVA